MSFSLFLLSCLSAPAIARQLNELELPSQNSTTATTSHLKVSWSDCSGPSAHGKISKVTFDPPVPELGSTFKVVGAGSIDEEVVSGDFKIHVQAGWIGKTYSGNVCGDTVIEFPLGAAKATIHGMKCPQAAGPVSVPAEIWLSSYMPASSASMRMSSTDKNGQELLCLDVKLEVVSDSTFSRLHLAAQNVFESVRGIWGGGNSDSKTLEKEGSEETQKSEEAQDSQTVYV